MKAFFKILVVMVTALSLSGCLVSGGGMNRSGGGFLTVDDGVRGGQPGYGGGYRHPADGRCQPYQADALMNWAQSAGGGQNVQHTRTANVSNNNGHVTCSSSEMAASGVATTRQYVTPQYVAPAYNGATYVAPAHAGQTYIEPRYAPPPPPPMRRY